MTFIDAPIARCEAMRTMVLTDETQAECAREHDCPPGQVCPLCGWFTEVSGVVEASVPKAEANAEKADAAAVEEDRLVA